MRILLAEDDFASRGFMVNQLSKYGDCDVTIDGEEAVGAYMMALEDKEPYDLICLDVMMPLMDGYQVLQAVRMEEAERGIPEDKRAKIVMITALHEEDDVQKAFKLKCDAYSGKPLDIQKFEQLLKKMGLL